MKMGTLRLAASLLVLVTVVACLAAQLRATARAELLMRRAALGERVSQSVSQLDAKNPNWWARELSNTAADVFWPHRKLLPPAGTGTGLVLLNPGELSGELKDPDDPWGYSHPRWYLPSVFSSMLLFSSRCGTHANNVVCSTTAADCRLARAQPAARP